MRRRSWLECRSIAIYLFAIAFCITPPASSELKDDEVVTFFHTFANMKNDRSVDIHVHGWIYEPELKSRTRALLIKAIEKSIGEEHFRDGRDVFESRFRLFLADNQRAKKIKIRIGNDVFDAGMSSPDGHFTSIITMDYDRIRPLIDRRGRFTITLAGERPDSMVTAGVIRIVPTGGLAVISDIDDTIKISNVSDKKEMIRNTFLRPYKAVPGMARLYTRWEKRGASFHYVSGSPWHLYLPLNDFIETGGFPDGSLYLKEFRLKDTSGLNFIVGDNFSYKLRIIEGILQNSPKTSFILVGDSGERDPEVYARILKNYPGRVRAIYIREVGTGIDHARYDALFNGSPVFHVFRDAAELK